MDTKFHRRKIGLAFYELPLTKRSSAEIISEARAEMANKRNGVVAIAPGGIRAVDTKRPFTPREYQRTLFGRAGRLGVSRPPSAVSLRYLKSEKIDGETSNPVPWLLQKPVHGPQNKQEIKENSNEISKLFIPTICHSIGTSQRLKLPNLPQPVQPSSRLTKLQLHAASLVNLPEEDEERLSIENTQTSQILIKSTRSKTAINEIDHDKITQNKLKTDTNKISTIFTDSAAGKEDKNCLDGFHSQTNNATHSNESTSSYSALSADKSITHSSSSQIYIPTPQNLSRDYINNSEPYHNNRPILKKENLKEISSNQEINSNTSCYAELVHITQALNLEAENDNNVPKIISIIQHLYKTLEVNDLLGSKLSLKSKAQILRSLYKYVEHSSNEVLLAVAHVVLALCVTGNNLAGVCKLIFKVSRSDKNDHLFLKGNILELFVNALGTAEPMEDAEACIYGYGALKFLTMNSILLSKLLSFGALELMVLHMKVINKWKMDGGHISEQTSHALFQLTGALRNVAGEEEEPFPGAFVSSGVISELCCTIHLFSCDLDIISNVSRTLSILSTHDMCCSAIIEYENSLKTLVKLIKKFPGRQDIVVRLSYVLGNLMAKSDKARLKFHSEENAIICLMDLLFKYIEIDLSTMNNNNFKEKLSSTKSTSCPAEDVLVKIVRIIANMSISPIVGLDVVGMNKDEDASNEICTQILNALLSILKNHQVRVSPELVLSSLATLNNLSFWAGGVVDGDFSKRQVEVAEALHSIIMDEHKESLVEAVRVFGNLTQSKTVRDYTVESGILERLILLLNKSEDISMDLLTANVGVLVNMMADIEKRRILANHNVISRLIEILKKSNGENWNLSSLICQVLWNYTIESKDLYFDLGKNETEQLVNILVDYLDEEQYFGVPEGSEIDPAISMTSAYQEWDEFAVVATDLLEKIETFLETNAIQAVYSVNNT